MRGYGMSQVQYANHIANTLQVDFRAYNQRGARYIFAVLKKRYDQYISYLREERKKNMKLSIEQRKLLLKIIVMAEGDNNLDCFTDEEKAELELLKASIGRHVK